MLMLLLSVHPAIGLSCHWGDKLQPTTLQPPLAARRGPLPPAEPANLPARAQVHWQQHSAPLQGETAASLSFVLVETKLNQKVLSLISTSALWRWRTYGSALTSSLSIYSHEQGVALQLLVQPFKLSVSDAAVFPKIIWSLVLIPALFPPEQWLGRRRHLPIQQTWRSGNWGKR